LLAACNFNFSNRVESTFGESKRVLAKQTKRSGKGVLGLEEKREDVEKNQHHCPVMPTLQNLQLSFKLSFLSR